MGLRWQAVHDLQIPLDVRDAEAETGPVFASEQDRGARARQAAPQSNIDELPAIVERPQRRHVDTSGRVRSAAVRGQFKNKIPRTCCVTKGEGGITGWAQVHGWRGNTSIEKRIGVRPVLHRTLVRSGST